VIDMDTTDLRDDVDAGLSALRAHDADPRRARAIRERCLAALSARRAHDAAREERTASRRAWLEPALALGLGALYLASAVIRALAVYR
jgi:ferric-dicitrate binding protein FerR (iron transport regulator)